MCVESLTSEAVLHPGRFRAICSPRTFRFRVNFHRKDPNLPRRLQVVNLLSPIHIRHKNPSRFRTFAGRWMIL
jgi:ABC-type iron transport system FetAB ATPase subunit